MKRYVFPALLIVSLLLIVLPGCVKKETPKKVSLSKRSGDDSQIHENPRPNTLWFGFDVKLGPKEEVSIYTPFLKYLEKTTGRRFRIQFTPDYEDTIKNLGTGATDFAAIGPLSYVVGKKEYGIQYLVSGVNGDGDPRYRAAIISGSRSGSMDLQDLRGKCFAFGAEMSTQGHLIPRKMLEDAGITLDDLGRHLYTGSYLNAVKAVLNNECDAGSIQYTLAQRLVSEGKIKIIRVSGPYPSSLIAYNGALDSRTVESVRTALLAFEPEGRHKALLIDWDRTEMPLGFSAIDEYEFDKVMTLAYKYGLVKK